jgi:NADH-quinone oxidoreductase subunit J
MIYNEYILFHVCGFLAVLSAYQVITVYNPVHSVLFLIFVFCNIAIMLLICKIEFIAIMFIIIYVGAIAILFLFVVMMLDIEVIDSSTNKKTNYYWISLIICAFFLFGIITTVSNFLFYNNNTWSNYISTVNIPNEYLIETITNTETIGHLLYTQYSFFLLSAGLILLLALLGSVTLTINSSYFHFLPKNQKVSRQLSRRPKNTTVFF